MFSVLMRAFSFTLIIIIGIVMKSTGFVPKDAGASVKNFLIYVTFLKKSLILVNITYTHLQEYPDNILPLKVLYNYVSHLE